MIAQLSGPLPGIKTATAKMISFLSRLRSMASTGGNQRKLRISETLSFGEKRFIAVVEYEQKKFLVAGTAGNISLLQRLDRDPEKDNHEQTRGYSPE